jgi:hypothetical protein
MTESELSEITKTLPAEHATSTQ